MRFYAVKSPENMGLLMFRFVLVSSWLVRIRIRTNHQVSRYCSNTYNVQRHLTPRSSQLELLGTCWYLVPPILLMFRFVPVSSWLVYVYVRTIRYHDTAVAHTTFNGIYLPRSSQLELLGTCLYLVPPIQYRRIYMGYVPGFIGHHTVQARWLGASRWSVVECQDRSPTRIGLSVGWFYLEIACYRRMVAVCVVRIHEAGCTRVDSVLRSHVITPLAYTR